MSDQSIKKDTLKDVVLWSIGVSFEYMDMVESSKKEQIDHEKFNAVKQELKEFKDKVEKMEDSDPSFHRFVLNNQVPTSQIHETYYLINN